MAATVRYLVHNSRLLQWVLVLDSCQLSAEGGCRSGRLFGCCIFCIPISHLHLNLLHRGWTQLLGAPLLALSLCGACWPSLQRPQDSRSLPGLLWNGPLQPVSLGWWFMLSGRGRKQCPFSHGMGGERPISELLFGCQFTLMVRSVNLRSCSER